MPLIRETILVTENVEGAPQIAPLGLIAEDERWIVAPFRPSTKRAFGSAVGRAGAAGALAATALHDSRLAGATLG